MKKLTEIEKGGEGRIKSLEGGRRFTAQLRTMGLKEGSKLRVIAIEPFGGPVVVKSHNTTITLGRGKAEKIIMEE